MHISKKGSEIETGSLVVIMLAIITLVIIIVIFFFGWDNLKEKFNIFSKANLDAVRNSCEYACTIHEGFDYCCLKRDVRFKDEFGKIDSQKYTGNNALNCSGYEKVLKFKPCVINCDIVNCTG